jgi:hypothetical protein
MEPIKKVTLILGLMFLVGQISCSNSPTSSTPTSGTIKISVKAVTSGAPVSVSKSASQSLAVTTITSAKIVISKIKFESIVNDTLDFRFRQPFVQDLMVGADVHVIDTIEVPFGSYKESEIEIDDLEPEDGEVYNQNPDLQDLSIRVEGSFNGNPFVFTSDLSEEQEREFEPPLVLDENSPSTNIVLVLNLDMWFVDSNGNPLDPSLPNNKSIIENNIKNSLQVFEDEDDDGEDDDDGKEDD